LLSLERRRKIGMVIGLGAIPASFVFALGGFAYSFVIVFVLLALPPLFDNLVALKTKMLYHPPWYGEGDQYITMEDGKFEFCFVFIANIVFSILLFAFSHFAYTVQFG